MQDYLYTTTSSVMTIRRIAKAFVAPLLALLLIIAAPAQAMVHGDDFNAYIIDDRLPERQRIWNQIRRSSKMPLPPVNKWIEHEIKRFERSPRYLKRLLTRSAPYIHYVVHELRKADLPLHLALLPVIESGYDPFAYSAGRASGIWQFISSTARIYGLEINWWYDGRRDIATSTNAAIRFLTDLHVYAKGDWPHALAAYNTGWARVSQHIKRNKRMGRSTQFWHLGLPRETRNYVPRFYALAHIVQNPEKYNVTLPAIPNRSVLAFVDINSQIDLAHAASLAHLSPTIMYKLNPGFNRWATPPQGPHVLALPKSHHTIFTEALNALSDDERIKLKEHKILPGESLSVLAHRYSATVDDIVRLNNLDNKNHIRADSHIIIPSAIYPAANYSYTSQARLSKSIARAKPTKDTYKKIHVVKASESLWSIAKRYGIKNYKDIAILNKISPKSVLRPGQELLLFVPKNSQKNISSDRKPIIRKILYTIRRNDSLSKIAKKFSVSTKSLVEWNNLDENKIIRPGQQLVLYVDVISGK